MRIETISRNLYKFDELTEDAKQKALERLYDINTSFDWWDSIYDDAKTVGVEILEFDIDRGGYVKAKFTEDACFTARKILENHGDTCETFKDATIFLAERDKIVDQAEKDKNGDYVDEYALDAKLDDVESEFLRTLQEDYRIMLQKEYEYMTSKEAILETIEANDYEFTEDGKLA